MLANTSNSGLRFGLILAFIAILTFLRRSYCQVIGPIFIVQLLGSPHLDTLGIAGITFDGKMYGYSNQTS
ncbi:MAG: hypothetical protein ABSE06_08085 [Anaerolineaceae bacterium]|jgi:hypothetical protein